MTDDIDPTAFTTLYFGFATNLSSRTLQSRCPGSLYVGPAILKNYKFIISEVGFGNIVPSDNDIVYGSLYFLTASHEKSLDAAEMHKVDGGEKTWHIKRHLKICRVETSPDDGINEVDEVEAMTYIDEDRTSDGVASRENLTFLRRAIDDGLQSGVPRSYFDKYWKRFLPEDESVGRQEDITMVRTNAMDREDSSRYVPRDILGLAGKDQ